jgi:hypothetical protein
MYTITSTCTPSHQHVHHHNILLFPKIILINLIQTGTDDTNFNKNPLCAIEELHVGEGKSFYCNMFGQIISIQRTSKAAIHMSEMLVNPINPSKTHCPNYS